VGTAEAEALHILHEIQIQGILTCLLDAIEGNRGRCLFTVRLDAERRFREAKIVDLTGGWKCVDPDGDPETMLDEVGSAESL